tara:strand:- start:2178 stop:2813 length:636 start_codon:yes stop_codon:yes gene_type:complete
MRQKKCNKCKEFKEFSSLNYQIFYNNYISKTCKDCAKSIKRESINKRVDEFIEMRNKGIISMKECISCKVKKTYNQENFEIKSLNNNCKTCISKRRRERYLREEKNKIMEKNLKAKEVNIDYKNKTIKKYYPLGRKFKDKKTQIYYNFFARMLKANIKKKEAVILLKNIATYGKSNLDKVFKDSFTLNTAYVNKLVNNDFLQDIEPINYNY